MTRSLPPNEGREPDAEGFLDGAICLDGPAAEPGVLLQVACEEPPAIEEEPGMPSWARRNAAGLVAFFAAASLDVSDEADRPRGREFSGGSPSSLSSPAAAGRAGVRRAGEFSGVQLG